MVKKNFLLEKNNMKIWKKFYECECSGDGIMLSHEQEPLLSGDTNTTIYLAFFAHGWDGSINLWRRLKYCFHLLKTGLPYTDMVVLNRRTCEELGRDLIKFSERTKDEN